MNRLKFLFAAALGMLLLSGTQVRASSLSSVQWEYRWTVTNPVGLSILADANGGGQNGFVLFVNNFNGNWNPSARSGNSNVVATNLRSLSDAPASDPNSLSAAGAFSLQLDIRLKNNPSQMATYNFNGKLKGDFSSESSNIEMDLVSPMVDTKTIGGIDFVVKYISFVAPDPQASGDGGAVQLGSIGFRVELTNGGQVEEVPEPSTIVLSCLGLSFLGVAGLRKRRQNQGEVTPAV